MVYLFKQIYMLLAFYAANIHNYWVLFVLHFVDLQGEKIIQQRRMSNVKRVMLCSTTSRFKYAQAHVLFVGHDHFYAFDNMIFRLYAHGFLPVVFDLLKEVIFGVSCV